MVQWPSLEYSMYVNSDLALLLKSVMKQHWGTGTVNRDKVNKTALPLSTSFLSTVPVPLCCFIMVTNCQQVQLLTLLQIKSIFVICITFWTLTAAWCIGCDKFFCYELEFGERTLKLVSAADTRDILTAAHGSAFKEAGCSVCTHTSEAMALSSSADM